MKGKVFMAIEIEINDEFMENDGDFNEAVKNGDIRFTDVSCGVEFDGEKIELEELNSTELLDVLTDALNKAGAE